MLLVATEVPADVEVLAALLVAEEADVDSVALAAASLPELEEQPANAMATAADAPAPMNSRLVMFFM